MVAIASLVFSLLFAQGKTLYQQVVEKPNPANGYEDYIRAADIARAGQVSSLLTWRPENLDQLLSLKAEAEKASKHPKKPQMTQSEEESEPTWNDLDEARLTEAKRLSRMSFLEVQREAVSKAGRALELVRVGNTKQAWDPRTQPTPETLFPELTEFKLLARLSTAQAYVDFSDGRGSEGTAALLETLRMSQQIGRGVLIANLVGSACTGIALASFEEHLQNLSAKDAERIVAATDAITDAPPALIDSLAKEKEFIFASLHGTLFPAKAKGDFGESAKEEDPWDTFLRNMSPAQRQAVEARVSTGINAKMQVAINRLRGPEDQWWVNVEEVDVIDPASRPSPQLPPSVDGIVDLLSDMLMPVYDQAVNATLQRRVQVRLLGLHARVILYRWNNKKLPNSLADAAPESRRYDPLSKQQFVYERISPTEYRLYSNGNAALGRVELRYRRSTADPDDSLPPPPSGSAVR